MEREAGRAGAAIELHLLREFRDAVLAKLKRDADGVWERQLMALSGQELTLENIRTPQALREVQDAAAARVESEAAIERRIGPRDGGNVAVMQRHPRLKQRYLAAVRRFGAAIVAAPNDWIELTIVDLLQWAKTEDPIGRRVCERWLIELMPGLYGTVEARERLRKSHSDTSRRGGLGGKGKAKRPHVELFWRAADLLDGQGAPPTPANVRRALRGWRALVELGDPLPDLVEVNVRGSEIDVEYTARWAETRNRGRRFVEVDDDALAAALKRRPTDR